ncbi:MAG: cysteine desulfurase [Acidimicrobiales bacterium]|nr:MAG: cysteine desulfurase [Acidimicrobiales bacterium]
MDTPLDRDQFPVTRNYVYLNHAGVAALPKVAARRMTEVVTSFMGEGVLAETRFAERAGEVRRTAAWLMGVPEEDVALVKNTTEGLSFVANGLEWEPGDRVLIPEGDFPSLVWPFLTLNDVGVRVDTVRPRGEGRALTIDDFAKALAGGGAKLVAVSWVDYQTGWRVDLAALASLCHEFGALLCVDAIQGLGVIPAHFNQWGVDFAASGGHKWMLGPLGTGVLYVAGRHRDMLRVSEAGWNSVAHRYQWNDLRWIPDPTARRYEGGSMDLAAIAGLGSALELLREAGVDNIWSHVDELCRHACVRLLEAGAEIVSERAPEVRSGIVVFRVEGEAPDQIVAYLRERGFVCVPRGGGVRISPHAYNTIDEIDALAEALASMRLKRTPRISGTSSRTIQPDHQPHRAVI